jgi:hypothetical protein
MVVPVLGTAALAQAISPESPFACDRSALSAAGRKRHFDDLGPQLQGKIKSVRELPGGYEFQFPADPATFRLAAEWAAGEHLCCPFFDIDLRQERENGAFWMRLSGRPGVKQFIEADLGKWIAGKWIAGKWIAGKWIGPAGREPASVGLDASQVLDAWITNVENEVVSAASALAEEHYQFAPANGEFHGVRTFAGQVKHLAANNYEVAARILGEKPPHGEHGEEAPDSVRSKSQIVEYLSGSFAYLHRAMAVITEKTLTEPIPGTQGTWQRTRLGLAVDAVAHSYDHYGQMVEYLRMNGVTPPASR